MYFVFFGRERGKKKKPYRPFRRCINPGGHERKREESRAGITAKLQEKKKEGDIFVVQTFNVKYSSDVIK